MEAAMGFTPQALLMRPVLPELLKEVTQAHAILLRRCSIGFNGRNPISLPDIAAYFELYGKPSFSVEVFEFLLGVLEQAAAEK